VLLSFFPEYTDLRGEKDAIKLRHLLTMSTGLDVNTSVVWNASPRIPLNKPLLVPPGRRFVYADEITQLISTVLQKATGQRFDDLARTLIFEPLGISDVIWTPIDSGNVAVWAHLYMRPRDMAKLGQLVLQRGLWNGQQLVPAAYIDAATSPQIAALSRGSYAYGYQFWIDTRPFCRVGTTPCETQVALSWGNGGQHFYVVPALDLVVVTTAGLYGTSVRSDTMPLAILDTVLSAANFDHVPTITPQSGWWWAPSAPGMGLGIETSGSNAAVGAYLYDTDGSAVWYIAMGALSGSSFSGSMVEYAGGQTLGGSYRANSVNRIAGTMSIAFTSATTGTLTWPGGSVAIERFNITSGGVSAGSASGDPQKGWWWGASESGRGYFIETQGANRTLFMAAYMYDTDGSAVWYSASGDLQTSVSGTGRTFTGTLSEYANGQTLGGAYQAPTVMATRGTISIEFTTTTTATLTLPSGAQVALTRFTF
jgi:CubicO group peptidase (beta-lactamase class C family)